MLRLVMESYQRELSNQANDSGYVNQIQFELKIAWFLNCMEIVQFLIPLKYSQYIMIGGHLKFLMVDL